MDESYKNLAGKKKNRFYYFGSAFAFKVAMVTVPGAEHTSF